MQIVVDFSNDSVAKKVMWFLDHLKSEGVKVVDNSIDKNISIKDDFMTLQIDAMQKTWDNDQDKAWDAL